MPNDGITLDASEFMQRINIYDERTHNAITRAMRRNAFDLWKEAGNLCPVSESGGTLMRSITASRVKWTDPTTVEVSVSANTPYAAIVHETMEPAIAVRTMHPGETTRAKPPTRFGNAGGKYLERPMLGKAQEYTDYIAKILKRYTAVV